MGISQSPVWVQTESYLGTLTSGVDSYAACVTKASVMLAFRRYLRLDACHGAPKMLATLLEETPLPSRWIPTVHANAVEMMLVDQLGSVEAFLELASKINREYLSSTLYRAAIRAFSPGMLLRGAAFRWGHFHRGTKLSVVSSKGKRAKLRLNFPDRLYDRVVAREKGTAFRVALEFADAKNPQVEITMLSATEVFYDVSWN